MSLRRRSVKIALALLAALLALPALALVASAALDRPSETIESEVTVDASVETVWSIVTGFEDYEQWNPFITKADGEARAGAEVDLELDPPDDGARDVKAEIVMFKPHHKLRMRSRLLAPGVLDREYEMILEPLEDGRVRVVQRARYEGILEPLTGTEHEQVGLDLMARAIEQRAENIEPGTTIRTGETWLCNRPLEDYGELPIVVRSRIDNAAAQPESVEAVLLSGGCTGDGNPKTVDLRLAIEGDGEGVGPTSDAVRIKLGAHDIEIGGFANCGAALPESRQHGIYAMNGYRITFVDFRLGDPEAGTWTCRGAGGAFAIEARSGADPKPEDIVCLRCAISSSHLGLYIGDSVRSGARYSTFVAPYDVLVGERAEDPITTDNSSLPLEP